MTKTKSKTKTEISLTPKEKEEKTAIDTSKPVTWSIRRVEPDTRRVIEKAAERIGKTLGQYINEDIRAFCQSQIKQSQLPASPKDIQNQIDNLTQLVEGLVNRLPEQGKKSLWARIFK